MAIGHVDVRGTNAYVFDEKGKQLYIRPMTNHGQMVGYTANTLSIKIGNNTYIYDDKGRQVKIIPN